MEGEKGGGTPYECLRRELYEELEIIISPEQVVFEQVFPAILDQKRHAYFMVVQLNEEDIATMKFGSEGQDYKFIEVDEFREIESKVPGLQERLESYLKECKKK